MDIKKLNVFELQQLKEIVQDSILELTNLREINIADKRDIKELNSKIRQLTDLLKNIKNEIYDKLTHTTVK